MVCRGFASGVIFVELLFDLSFPAGHGARDAVFGRSPLPCDRLCFFQPDADNSAMMAPLSGLDVRRIDQALWPDAARLLAPGHGQAAHWAALALVDRWSADRAASQQLVGAFVAGKLVAAGWIEPLSRQSAVLWPPREIGAVHEVVLRSVLHECRRVMESAGISWAQCLTKSPTPLEHSLLVEFGFEKLNDLFYLFRPVCVGDVADEAAAATVVEHPETAVSLCRQNAPCGELGPNFVEVAEQDRARLAAIVGESYRDTLDYPQLNGLRAVDEVLESYESIGSSGTSLWRIVRYGNEEIGCLLLADHPEDGNLELVYMGVLPRFRGMGWGTSLVAYACRTAVQRARQRVVLAVDAGNAPALRIYRSLGFSVLDQRAVYFWRKPD